MAMLAAAYVERISETSIEAPRCEQTKNVLVMFQAVWLL